MYIIGDYYNNKNSLAHIDICKVSFDKKVIVKVCVIIVYDQHLRYSLGMYTYPFVI